MIFNQFAFLFLFLPVVTAVYFMPGMARQRAMILIVASFVFYSISGLVHATVLAIDILWVYAMIHSPRIFNSKIRLALAITPPFLALFYYKYLGFFLEQVLGLRLGGDSFQLFANVVLPAGISFFTFQLASVAIDRYRGDIPELPTLRHFIVYICLFPQLVAGPIIRLTQIAQNLANLERFRPDANVIAKVIGYVTLGLAVKVLIADTLDGYLTPLEANPLQLSSTAAVYVISAYSFQIYFDFYGYSLIAIGLGALFGFHFPDNFLRPYSALNPRDFWRRWHVTLSFWIRDYLYFPIGGNASYIRNILIVFAVCGLWHGAGWNFIVWGLFHGVLVTLYHRQRAAWNALPEVVQWAMTFTLVSVGWTLFLFDLPTTVAFLKQLVGLGNAVSVADPSAEMWIMVLVSAVVCFGVKLEPLAENVLHSRGAAMIRNVAFAVAFILTLVFLDRSQTFVYFRF